jgi:hypothetical protein
MAKTAAKKGQAAEGETLTGYFRRILREDPKLLKTRSNDELLRRWQADHPGEEVTNKTRAGLQNAKSALRSRRRKRRAGRREAEQPQEAVAHVLPKPTTPPRHLETLEEQIDDCLSLAKGMDREGLDDVIRLLRRARNQVVWKMGQ